MDKDTKKEFLSKLEAIEQEDIVGYSQEQKQRKFNAIIILTLYKHKLLNDSQLEEIKRLEII